MNFKRLHIIFKPDSKIGEPNISKEDSSTFLIPRNNAEISASMFYSSSSAALTKKTSQNDKTQKSTPKMSTKI